MHRPPPARTASFGRPICSRPGRAPARSVLGMAPTSNVIGLAVADMAAAPAFYRRLGLQIPAEADAAPHVEVALPGGLRMCVDTHETIRSFDPSFVARTGLHDPDGTINGSGARNRVATARSRAATPPAATCSDSRRTSAGRHRSASGTRRSLRVHAFETPIGVRHVHPPRDRRTIGM
jgi:hypothetical protein